MKIFYDTEFIERGPTHPIDLVSIGMVAEDGREFYAVSAEFDQQALLSNPWLAENVWPSLPATEPRQYRDRLPPHGRLDLDHPDVRSRAQIARAVESFVQQTATAEPTGVELWAWYGAYDHVVLAQLFGRMTTLPECVPMFTCDLRQEAQRLGIDPAVLPQQEAGHHNALADARHNKVINDHLTQFEQRYL